MVKWRGRRKSTNVEDRRGQGGGFPFPFPRRGGRGGGMRIPIPMGRGRRGGGFSIWTILIILGLVWFFGGDLGSILGRMGGGGSSGGGGGGIQMPRIDTTGGSETGSGSGEAINPFDIPGLPGSTRTARTEPRGRPSSQPSSGDDAGEFVKVMLADTEDIWHRIFKKNGRRYQPPKLVLFNGFTSTRCGPGQSAMGPFYCPLDQKVYVDLSFFEQLRRQFGAPGDFAQAYVIAHEVGHHVQTLYGIAEKVQHAKQRMSKRESNKLQVRMELQADCLAGVWANEAHEQFQILEAGDIEEGLNAAKQIGDDMIQRRTQGRIVPDAFTHGSSEQRVRWFRIGFEGGDPGECDTFSKRRL